MNEKQLRFNFLKHVVTLKLVLEEREKHSPVGGEETPLLVSLKED